MKSVKMESSSILALPFKQPELWPSGERVSEVSDLASGQTPDHAALLTNKMVWALEAEGDSLRQSPVATRMYVHWMAPRGGRDPPRHITKSVREVLCQGSI